MVQEALCRGLNGIGIADRNSVAGVVRAYVALQEMQQGGLVAQDFRLIVGARLLFVDGTPDIVAYPVTRTGWGRWEWSSLPVGGHVSAEPPRGLEPLTPALQVRCATNCATAASTGISVEGQA